MIDHNKNYTVYLVSNKPHLFEEIQQSFSPEPLNYFDGTNKGCFAKIINTCVEQCPTETVIIMSDKMRPKSTEVKKILDLLNLGFGFVGLYRFGFFGFRKELFRKVGPLDERYIGGGYEDDDFYLRLKEADIACYITEESDYKAGPSSWNYELSKTHFILKWIPSYSPSYQKIKKYKIERAISEELYQYNWGPSTNIEFLKWDNSHAPVLRKLVRNFERK